MSETGKLVVIAGPSGVGKGTLVNHIVNNFPGFYLSVSATTRAPRVGEQEGVSYYFYSESEFDELVASGQMLEWARVHGQNSYGTPKGPVRKAMSEGLNVLLEIDVQGAFQVRAGESSAILVFVKPPSFAELKARLDKRGTETEQEKEVRLETARQELLQADSFDFQVVNDEVDRCAQEVVDLIQST